MTSATRAAAMVRRRRVAEWCAAMQPVAAALQAEGLTLAEIAARLNDAGHRTRQGRLWTYATVHLLLRGHALTQELARSEAGRRE